MTTRTGRFEEMGHFACRALVAWLCRDLDPVQERAGFDLVPVAVAVGWALASPAIYGGMLLDRMSARRSGDLGAEALSSDPLAEEECVFPHWACGHDPEVPPVVIDA